MTIFNAQSRLRNPLRRRQLHGSIEPELNKTRSLRSRLMPMPLPAELTLPLAQYHGTDLEPMVEVGDRVLKYQLLAADKDNGNNHLHAPTSGIISAFRRAPMAGTPDTEANCIILQCDGQDAPLQLQPLPDYQNATSSKILDCISAAGILGMGGAGFPTALKLGLAADHGVELLIINAAECEPYISADEALIRERAAHVVTGADILRTCCHAPRCVIAIEQDKTDAVVALQKELAHSPIELMLLHSAYPAGSEKQLVQSLTGLEVPSGKYPIDLGIVVQNAGTAYAAYQAVIEGSPCISRVTTVTGTALQTPKNFEVLIGTSVAFLLELCGVDGSTHQATVIGGSLMGIELASTDVPITKSSNCLIAATAREFPAPEPERACIRCGYCADACPSRLLPQQLYSYARTHHHEQLVAHGLNDCIECGACAYVCPSKIPLVQYYLAAKQELRALSAQKQQSAHWQARFQVHQYRLKREQDSPPIRRQKGIQTQSAALAEDTPLPFSRTQAQQEIAAAVARAKARKMAAKNAAGENQPPPTADED